MLTLKAALEDATAAIGRVDAHVLVAHLLGVDRTYLIANPMRVLTESEDARIESLIAQRVLGRPVAYLVAKREFHGREFAVGPDVLIPRPETETLVEAALERVAPAARVLDLGTGSGAIAVTLACERPHARITATDTSQAALVVARANAESFAAADRVEWLCGHWYEPVAGRCLDAIVSNPPYVAALDPHLGRGDLRFEPASALTDGSRDGLDAIRAIVAGGPAHLEPRGGVMVGNRYAPKEAGRGRLAAGGLNRQRFLDAPSG